MRAGTSPRSLRALRADAARATTATELDAIARGIVLCHGPLVALKVLGSHWYLPTGKEMTARTLDWLIDRTALAGAVSRVEACRRIGRGLMDTSENFAFHRITLKPKIDLIRLTDLSRFTGWYQSREDAQSQWTHSKPPLALDKLTVNTDQILAVKWLKPSWDIVLVPGRKRYPERSFL